MRFLLQLQNSFVGVLKDGQNTNKYFSQVTEKEKTFQSVISLFLKGQ